MLLCSVGIRVRSFRSALQKEKESGFSGQRPCWREPCFSGSEVALRTLRGAWRRPGKRPVFLRTVSSCWEGRGRVRLDPVEEQMGKPDLQRRNEVMLARLSCYSVARQSSSTPPSGVLTTCPPGPLTRTEKGSRSAVGSGNCDEGHFPPAAQPEKSSWHSWGEAARLEQLGISWWSWLVVIALGLWFLLELVGTLDRTLSASFH